MFLLLCALSLSLPGPSCAAPAADGAYEADVEFLLDAIEREAGTLLKQKGVDWKKVRRRFQKEARSLKEDADLADLVNQILAQARDGHAAIVDLGFEYPQDRVPPSQRGVGLSLVVSGRKVLVKDCYGPAAAAGVAPGWEVLSLDDQRSLDWLEARAEDRRQRKGYSTDHAARYDACHRGLADAEGTRFAFKFREPKGGTKSLTLTCARGGGNGVPFGPLAPPEGAARLGRHTYGRTAAGHGYLHLRKIEGELPQQLDQMLGELGDVPGLVLDFRANSGGGVDHEAVFSRFLAAGESFAGRRGAEDGAHYTGPLVLIADAGTASAAETVCGMLKESGRGYLIAPTPTAGMSGSKRTLELPSGKVTVRFTVRSYQAGVGQGPDIEGHGVEPHQRVEYDPKVMLEGKDPLIEAAERLLEEGLPRRVVRYGDQG